MTESQGLGWLENTVCCSISIHSWGNSKGVKAADVSQFSEGLAEKAAEKRISVSKRLLNCKEYQAVTSRDGHAGKWFQEHSVPSMFRKGVYAVPTLIFEDWTAYVDAYKAERQALVSTFREAYWQAVEIAEQELGMLYRMQDYPSMDSVESKFYVEVRYLTLAVPDKLALIDPATFAQATADLRRSVDDGKAFIEALMCQEVTELVQGLRSTLQGLDDGTIKRFHESHIIKLQEWSALFLEARNVTDDAELAKIVQSLGALASGIETESVKKFAFVRKDVKQALDGCLTDLKALMVARPGRFIDLDQE